MCPDPSSLTFEVEVADDDVTRAASSVDAPWPARLSSVDGKADDLQLSCRVLDGIVRPDADSVAVTRGSMVSSLSSFGVSAAVYPAASTYSAQPCGSLFFAQQVTAGAPTGWFWPGSGKEAAFYAYYPYGSSCFTLSSTAASVGVPVYSYTVPSSVASQPDIMTAQVTDVAGDTGGSVALPFRHRCAALRFSLTNEGSDAITVTSVSVSGVYGSGTLQGDIWTPGTPASTFTLAPTGGWTIAADETVDLTGTSNIFFMVPQTIPAGAKIVVVTSEDTYEAELSGTWLAGKTMEYEITKVAADYIDLGLPSGTLWAKGNIVSDGNGGYKVGKETDYGAYFSWGNVTPHFSSNGSTFDDGYNWGTSNTGSPYTGSAGASISYTSQHKGRDYAANTTNDAARACLGGNWQVPTATKIRELIENCTWTKITKNDIIGFEFTSNLNGVKIFFPLAGYGSGNSVSFRGSRSHYWSSSLGNTNNGYNLKFNNTSPYVDDLDRRYYGFSVRAVLDGPNYHEGHELIDLGLPSGNLWATTNVGASAPEQSGLYFSWGNTVGYTTRSGSNFDSSTYNTKTDGYGVDLTEDIPANAIYDAAQANWGSGWRIPTKAECEELITGCNYSWSTLNGNEGMLLTSKTNGNTLFLPKVGVYYIDDPNNANVYARMSLSSIDKSNISNHYNFSYQTQYDVQYVSNGRYVGRTIRPILPPHTITLQLRDGSGNALSGVLLAVTDPNGKVRNVRTDAQGNATVNARNGIYTVKSGLYTLTGGSFTVSADATFNLTGSRRANGVYAYYEDGSLRDYASADGDAIGVAIITSERGLVIKKANAPSTMCWGGNNKYLNSIGIMNPANISEAEQDFDGESNTAKIIEALKDYDDGTSTGAPACEWCRAQFGGFGHLPAYGEVDILSANLSTVNSFMTQISGSTYYGDFMWTSTISNGAWTYRHSHNKNSNDVGTSRNVARYVRAFLKL